MTDKKDVLAEVGKYVAKEAAKQVAADIKGGGELVGAAREVNDMLNDVVARNIMVRLQVYRVDPMNPTNERYVGEIKNINPQTLVSQGMEALIQQWSGGGRYKIKMQADGIKEKIQNLDIEGDPMPPLPERLAKGNGVPANALLPGSKPGQWVAGSGFEHLLGFPNPQMGAPGDAATNKALGSMENVTSILLAKMLGGGDDRRGSGDNEELKKANEAIAELKRERDLATAQAQHQKEMGELNAKLEKMIASQQQPRQSDTLEKILAVAATAIPAFLQAKASSDMAQTQMLTALIASNNKSDPNQALLLQAVLSKPSESDQMMKMYEAIGGMMGTSVQLTQGIINQMASLQGGEQRTWWQEAVLNLATSVGDIAQAAMSRSEVVRGGQVIDAESEEDDTPQLDDAAAAAAAAAQQQLAAGAPAPQVAGYVGPSRKDPRFASDSFTQIFRLIEDKESSPHEVAFRVWKHATSGNVDALAWTRDPEGYTAQLLLSFVQRAEMALTEERFDAIVASMVDLYEHFSGGGTPEAYLAHYELKLQPPKRINVVPIERSADEQPEEEEVEAAPAEEPQGPPVIVPSPTPSTVPTPGLDRVPPPPREPPPVVTQDRVPPPTAPQPVPSAADHIPVEPKA